MTEFGEETFETLEKHSSMPIEDLCEEFSNINPNDYTADFTSGSKNKKLNRYKSIMPIESSRIILTTQDSDYINAKFLVFFFFVFLFICSKSLFSVWYRHLFYFQKTCFLDLQKIESEVVMRKLALDDPKHENYRYIATQCPILKTVEAFWRMVLKNFLLFRFITH